MRSLHSLSRDDRITGWGRRGAPIPKLEPCSVPRRDEFIPVVGVGLNDAEGRVLYAALYYSQRPVMSSGGLFWP